MAESGPSFGETPWRQSLYDQLHVLARQALTHETPGHSLQPTLLANDAYLKLLQQQNVNPRDRSQVLAVGANIIRRLLVDSARRRNADKRGGGRRPVHNDWILTDDGDTIDIVALNDALNELEGKNPRAGRIVELKFFAGLSREEIAAELGVSPRTVSNDWRFAKSWLYSAMSATPDRREADG